MQLRLGALGLGTLLAVVAIACLPTVGTLGYPSALLASPLFALFGLRVGLRELPRVGGPRPALGGLARVAAGRLAVVLALAFVCFAASSWIQGASLDLGFGLACLALGPGLSGALGWTCGLFGGAVSSRRDLRVLVALAAPASCLALAAWRLYADPAVFAYDPFVGMISGSIYDLDTEVGSTYPLHRAYCITVAAGALLCFALAFDRTRGRLSWRLARLRARETPGRAVAALLLLGAGASVGAQPARFGFHQTAENLRSVLSASFETEHFVLRYRPGSANAREIRSIASEHEFNWHEHEERLGRAPRARIESFLFDSPRHKRELLGVGAAELAAPWRAQMYMQYQPWPHPTLPHELAHVFGAPFGDPIFGIALDFPRVDGGLIEGFAEALSPRADGRLDGHDRAAILDRIGLCPPLEQLFGWGFWSAAPARAYTAVGSFCDWIAQRHGFAALGELYARGGDFERVLGRPLAALEAEWRAFLRARDLAPEDVERERRRYERGSLFDRPHAYRVARLGRRIERALSRNALDAAIDMQRRIVALEPEPPEHRLALAELFAGDGRRVEAGRELATVLGEEWIASDLRAAAFELEGDLYLADARARDAGAAYERAAELALDRGARRRIALKQRASSGDAARRDAWLRYFDPFALELDPERAARARLAAALALRELDDDAALASYLAALQHMNLQEPREALPLVAQSRAALPEDADWPHPSFAAAALELELAAAAHVGELDRAAFVLGELRSRERGPGDRSRNERWARRLEFLRGWLPEGAASMR